MPRSVPKISEEERAKLAEEWEKIREEEWAKVGANVSRDSEAAAFESGEMRTLHLKPMSQ